MIRPTLVKLMVICAVGGSKCSAGCSFVLNDHMASLIHDDIESIRYAAYVLTVQNVLAYRLLSCLALSFAKAFNLLAVHNLERVMAVMTE